MKTLLHISFTTDVWSSINQDRYLGITVHGLDENFNIVTKNLATRELPQNHTAENIVTLLKQIFQEFDISEQIFVGVTDNASSMGAALCLLKHTQLPCFAHTLQLAINGALNMITITDIITKAKLITKFFKKSLVAAKELT